MNVGDVVTGLSAGAATALLALGIALIYKVDRTFNLAQGEFGTVAAYVTYVLTSHTHGYWLGLVAGMGAGMVMALVVQWLIVWPLRSADRVTLLVATAVVALLATAVETIVTSTTTLVVPAPFTSDAFSVGGVAVTTTDVVTFGVAVVVTIVASLVMSRTSSGRAVSAVAQDHEAAAFLGMPVRRISLVVWGAAGLLGGLAGVLLAPSTAVTPGIMTTAGLINALAAVVLGGTGSIVGALWGGLVVGVVEAVAYSQIGATVPGASELAVLVVLVAAMIVRAKLRPATARVAT